MEILPAGVFTEAEGYHRKYYLQVRSTLAARLNALAGGQLSRGR